MHEMPYTQAMIEMALKESHGKPIKAIRLAVGQMSAIVPSSMEFFFDVLSKESPALDGARLIFETVPMELTCQECGHRHNTAAGPDIMARQALAKALAAGCPSCRSKAQKVTGGMGVDLAGIELAGD